MTELGALAFSSDICHGHQPQVDDINKFVLHQEIVVCIIWLSVCLHWGGQWIYCPTGMMFIMFRLLSGGVPQIMNE